jgi:nicotinate-nucleotide adenylyltransferase
VFGGTFDPIHYGHLDAAEAAYRSLRLDEIRFLPSHIPPHRDATPHVSMFHRFALIGLALENLPQCRACDLELGRAGRSYTYDTLLTLHAEGWAPSQLFFIIGTDAFAEVATWRAYAQVIDGANFAVVGRTGTTIEAALARTPSLRDRVRRLDETREPFDSTGVYLIEAATRDVSSTQIRKRLAAGQPIADLVPESVERHIIRHGLYGAVDHLHGNT